MKIVIKEKEYEIVDSLDLLPFDIYLSYVDKVNKLINKEISEIDFNTFYVETLLGIKLDNTWTGRDFLEALTKINEVYATPKS